MGVFFGHNDFKIRVGLMTCFFRVDQTRCAVMDYERLVCTFVWISPIFQTLLIISVLPADVAVSSTQNEDRVYVDAMPAFSLD